MYRHINDFIIDWKYETESTIKVLGNIIDSVRTNIIHEQVRSLERLSWHLTQTITEMGHRAGIFSEDFLEAQPIPASIEALTTLYTQYSEELAKTLPSKWTDSSLLETVEMYGEEWEKGKVLSVIIHHQIHHRGQMTVIMRMLDLRVPGVYGPSKEEWAELGMTAPE